MIEHDPAAFAWSRRVLRIGGFIQVAFAAFWLIRGSFYLDGAMAWGSALGLGTVAAGVFVYGARVTSGKGTRPQGAAAARIERRVTAATGAQLVASFIAPEVAIYLGRPDWVLPSIAITIGPLLLWLDRRLHLPRYRWAGTILIAGPVALALIRSGATLAVVTGLGAGVVLLTTAGLGFRELGRGARPGARGPSSSRRPRPERPVGASDR